MLKKNLTAFAVLLFALITLSNVTFAQNEERSNKTPEEKATKMADRMKQNLSLTDVQHKQVYDIFLTKIQDRRSNKEKYQSMDKESRKQLHKQNREEMTKKFEGILNSDQITKFKELKEKHKQNRGKHKGEKNKENKKREKSE